ncbi:enoyl-CoA hydratase 2, peroxisomal isoform X2 [Phalaenopsis equestris]|uniref:enoyl-CoA hydratase 2, peroxisomal isoform X2 n=1 Tax=Phalaenopsis equestris TaxID=78828 RepID=UPI0009E2DEBE|nr:enoyl-CoA hydratase 2, peroxisomal isoform X2 [Phalaenopsis equestris]
MASSSSAARIDPEIVISHKFPEVTFSYSERDAAIYALGVGACGRDAVDEKELKYVFHQDGQQFIEVLPTFAALFQFKNNKSFILTDIPGLDFDPKLLLHGQQYIEIYKPFPSSCSVKNKVTVAGLHDKGKAAIIEIETTSYIEESGEALCTNRSALYLRGSGGFSKPSKPYSYTNYPADQVSSVSVPKHKPSVKYEEQIPQSQALLYRLSGDYNPLHSDPMVAKIAGFDRPILHGLCSLGFAIRAIIRSICNGDSTAVRSIFGRFLLHVYPGESLITEMWIEGPKVIYQTKVKERNKAVLSGYVMLKHIPSSL